MTIPSAPLLLVLLTLFGGGGADAVEDVAPGAWVRLTGLDDDLAVDQALRVWIEAASSDTSPGVSDDLPRKDTWLRMRVRGGVDDKHGDKHGDTLGRQARVPRVPAGLYRLWARWGGKDASPQWIQTLRVQAPEVLEVSTETLGDRTRVTAVGHHFGPRKGRVQVASRRARVLRWDVGVDDLGHDRVVFSVPRKLGDGLHPVSLATPAGSGRLDEALLVSGSGRGAEPVFRALFTADDDPVPGSATEPLMSMEAAANSVGYALGEGGVIHLSGRMGSKSDGLTLRASLRYDPATQGAADLRGTNALVTLTRADGSGHQLWASAYSSGGSIQVHVLENDGGVLHATFEGLLVAVYGLDVPLRVSGRLVAPPR